MQKKGRKESKQEMKRQKQEAKIKPEEKQRRKQEEKEEQQRQSSSGEDIDLNQVAKGEGEQDNEEIQINFLIGELNEDYYHSLKTVLLRFGQITKVTNAELADAVLQNKKIGNVSLAEDDESEDDEQLQGQQDDQQNVYSILTVIEGKSKVSRAIKKTVLQAAEKEKLSEQIKSIIKADSTSVIVNERLTNLPAFIASSSHEVFKKDMMELKKTERDSYNVLFSGYLLNVSEIQFEGSMKLDELIYSKFEDFEMCKRAKKWWLGERNQTFKKKADMRNLYYLISAEEYFKGIDQIKQYLQ